MAVLILIIFLLLTEESVLSDVQCDIQCTEALINHYIGIEKFERKLENIRIMSELKQISNRIGLIETDSVKDIGNIQQIANSFETDKDDIDQIKNITAEFITAIDKRINNQARTFSQDHELFGQRTLQKFSDFNKSLEISQQKSNQQIAKRFETVKNDIEQIKNIAVEFKTAKDKMINNQTRKWQQDRELYEQKISQQFSDFNRSFEISQQKNSQQIENNVKTVEDNIEQIENITAGFKRATDERINDQTRQWAQDFGLFEQNISQKISDFSKSLEMSQQENVQQMANSSEAVKDGIKHIEEFATEFKTATDKIINNQKRKWAQEHESFKQSILQKFSDFSKSLEIKHQKSDQQMANSFEIVKNYMEQLEKNIAQKEDDIKDHVIVDLGQAKKEIQTDLEKCIESTKDAKSSANECLNIVAALKSDVKDIETSMKISTDTVLDLKDKFEKHVDDATKRFHSAAKTIGTCRGMEGYEHLWKENWILHGSKCYRFVDKYDLKKNWNDAVEFCKRHNADLVQIESKEENDFIMAFDNYKPPSFWIGLNDRDTENVWKWQSTGSTLQSKHFTNWDENQPDDHNANEDCGMIYPGGRWNDFPCGESLPFICQKDPEL